MRALTLGALLALALPSSAMAATQYYIPPGNSSGNEYVENVPTAGGNTPSGGIGQHGSGGTGSHGALPPGTQSTLVSQGPDGSRTASFANATAPQGGFGSGPGSTGAGGGTAGGAGGTGLGGGGTGGNGGPGIGGSGGSGGGSGAHGGSGGTGNAGGGNGAAGTSATSAGGSSAATSVVRSLTGLNNDGGFGLLPIALLAIALGLAAIALRRRGRAT